MQWLGLLILLGILALLFLAAMYFGGTQKTSGRRSGSSLDDFYRSKGMGNVLETRDRLDGISMRQHHGSSPEKRRHHEHRESE